MALFVLTGINTFFGASNDVPFWKNERGSVRYEVALSPNEAYQKDSIFNEKMGKYEICYVQQMTVFVPKEDIKALEKETGYEWIFALTSMVYGIIGMGAFIILIAAIVNFWCLLKKIRKGEIFSEEIISRLNKLGWEFIAIASCILAMTLFDQFEKNMLIQLSGYDIVNIDTELCFDALMSGLVVLIVTEAVKQGKKMKEEQELTI